MNEMQQSTVGAQAPMANRGLAWRSVTVAVLVIWVALTITSSVDAQSQDSTEDPTLICKMLASSVSIARMAGKLIREVYKRKRHTEYVQSGRGYQTEADRLSQKCITASLSKLYPRVLLVAQEVYPIIPNNLDIPDEWIVRDLDSKVLNMKCPSEYKHVKQEQVVVWIDPLDGTKQFIKGKVEHVSILIGISVNNDIVAGVIYQPFYKKIGRAVWGLVGGGVGGLEVKSLARKRDLVYLTPYYLENYTHDYASIMGQPTPVKILRVRGSGNRVIQLLEGKAHSFVYPSIGLCRWDIAGPDAVLKAAGGRFTDTHGSDIDYCRQRALNPTTVLGIIGLAPDSNRSLGQYFRKKFGVTKYGR